MPHLVVHNAHLHGARVRVHAQVGDDVTRPDLLLYVCATDET